MPPWCWLALVVVCYLVGFVVVRKADGQWGDSALSGAAFLLSPVWVPVLLALSLCIFVCAVVGILVTGEAP